MAEVKIAIYKTPAQVGNKTTMYDTVALSKAEAIKLRDYCEKIEKGRVTIAGFISLCSPVIGVKLGVSVGTLIGTLTGANGLVASYLSQLGKTASDLVDTMATDQDVTFTYKYKRSGSNDGAYWLVGMK
ncbi:hypothetical protein [Emergencia timonensis]|uniref:hypothetical protein n=1 Tax=Emergencia timonensis TaxID=1776384 RepID=UPI0039961938